MSGGIHTRLRRNMAFKTGYADKRADAAALRTAREAAIAALDRLERNPADAALRMDAFAKRDRLAAIYRRVTGRELFDGPLGIRSGSAS